MKKLLAIVLVFSMFFGINEDTQEELLDKLRDGEVLDSAKQEIMDVDLVNQLDSSEIIVYDDGSRAEVGVELISFEPEEGFTTAGLHKERDPGKYSERVYWHSGFCYQSFYADFTINKGNDNDTIDNLRSYTSSTIGAKKYG